MKLLTYITSLLLGTFLLLIRVDSAEISPVSDSPKHTVEDEAKKTRTVADAIIACPNVNFMNKSKAILKCTTDIYSETEKLEVFDGNLNLPTCLTIRNLTQKICQHTSLVTPIVGSNQFEIKLPRDLNQFDEDLKNLEPKSGSETKFVASLCQNIQSLFDELSPGPEDTNKVPHVEYMKKMLFSKEEECGGFCLNSKKKVNPLCLVLLWGWKLFENVPPPEIHDSLKNPEADQVVPGNKPKETKLSNTNNSTKPDRKVKIDHKTTDQKQVSIKETSVDAPLLANPQVSDGADGKSVDDTAKLDESIKNDQASIHEESSIVVPPSISDSKTSAKDAQVPEKFEEEEALLNEEHSDKEGNNVENGDDGQKDYKDSSGESVALPQEKEKPYMVKGEEDASWAATYWSITAIGIILFIVYHNRHKIFAMVLEGPSSRRRRGSRRRHTASYHKLDCNLEEAVTSQCTSDVPHVIY